MRVKIKLPPKPRKAKTCSFRIENQYPEYLIAGIDEVGRGCLAGPVVVGGVVFSMETRQEKQSRSLLAEITDSKLIRSEKRRELSSWIKEHAIAWSVMECDVLEIEKLNILRATLKAAKAVAEDLISKLEGKLGMVLFDGNQMIPGLSIRQVTVVDGDLHSKSIAAASVLAKVHRDQRMTEYSEQYPHYEFHQNKGYGTQKHIEGLKKHGPCALHRVAFLQKLAYLEFGKECEEKVCRFLQIEGFEIAEKNWRGIDVELDVVAEKDGELHFFEVRSRRSNFQMELSFPQAKQVKFRKAVKTYLMQKKIRRPFRLHLVAVENDQITPHWDVFKLA